MEKLENLSENFPRLKLTSQDKLKINELDFLYFHQYKAVLSDEDYRKEFRKNFTLTEDEFTQIIQGIREPEDSWEEILSNYKGRLDLEKMKKEAEDRWDRVTQEDGITEEHRRKLKIEAEQKLRKIVPRSVDVDSFLKHTDEIIFAAEKMMAERMEPHALALMEKLIKINEQFCDRIFTTDQTGSETPRNDPDYDSIYYLFRLSDGSYLSQRFKRNNIQEGLHGVVSGIASIIVFEGPSVSGTYRGQYTQEQISTEPKIGMYVKEYFSTGMLSRRSDVARLEIPHVINISGNTVELLCDLDESTPGIEHVHDGTKVNKIIK
jgi:hypothetical protein